MSAGAIIALQDHIAELNDELARHLVPTPEFRNHQRIERLEEQIIGLEEQIEEIRGNSQRG